MQINLRYGQIRIYAFLLMSVVSDVLSSQIIIDEKYDDWEKIQTTYEDDLNDGIYDIDFSHLKIHNDSRYLYLNFTTGVKLNLQDNNDLILFLDIDNNNSTGFNINGIGADISYFFGDRQGYYYHNGIETEFFHHDIDLITLPTVSSNTFEMAISRSFFIDRSALNLGEEIKVLLLHNENGGDKVPNDKEIFSYKMNSRQYEKLPFSINKKSDAHLRIMSFNVERDHFFENEPPYQRLINAIAPDILCFQEIYDHNSVDVNDKIVSYFGGLWYHAKQGRDIIVVSKYPIMNSWFIGGNGAFLIDKDGREILVINAHLKCCDDDESRQIEVDQIMSFIRDSKDHHATFTLKEDTPIIILGDMNFVGSHRQRQTLLEGDIFNEQRFGIDFLPDWDDSFFEDARPITTGYPGSFTWNNDRSSFPKGRLDYIIYSGSVLRKENAYTLYTRNLSNDVLTQYGLEASDADNAADHFPVVVDFSFKTDISATNNLKKRSFVYTYPNPVNDIFNLTLSENVNDHVLLFIYNEMGKMMIDKSILVNQNSKDISIDVNSWSSGFYLGYLLYKGEYFYFNFVK